MSCVAGGGGVGHGSATARALESRGAGRGPRRVPQAPTHDAPPRAPRRQFWECSLGVAMISCASLPKMGCERRNTWPDGGVSPITHSNGRGGVAQPGGKQVAQGAAAGLRRTARSLCRGHGAPGRAVRRSLQTGPNKPQNTTKLQWTVCSTNTIRVLGCWVRSVWSPAVKRPRGPWSEPGGSWLPIA